MPDFIRTISDFEKTLIFDLLPENKPGYALYRKEISELNVIGYGRWGKSNLILGTDISQFDDGLPTSSVFAIGKFVSNDGSCNVVIHEKIEDTIEVDIAADPDFNIDQVINKWNYSKWKPGNKSPEKNDKVREVHLVKNSIVLAFAISERKIWVHSAETGINHIIPLTNYYNEIFRLKLNVDRKKLPNVNKFFGQLDDFSDELLGRGFLSYNKFLNKINLDYKIFEKSEKRKSKSFLSKIFTKAEK